VEELGMKGLVGSKTEEESKKDKEGRVRDRRKRRDYRHS
jgi:hypothetical protein